MSRSVNYLSGADYIMYFTDEWLASATDEWEWQDFQRNLISEITSKCKSFEECNKWGGREDLIFLENQLCEIAISEYCGLYSLSVRAKDDEFYDCNSYKNGLAKNYVFQIQKTLQKALKNCGVTLLNKIGTFSNGESVYKKVK